MYAGKRRVPPDVAARLAESLSDDDLTVREIEVLRLVAEGNRNQDIASRAIHLGRYRQGSPEAHHDEARCHRSHAGRDDRRPPRHHPPLAAHQAHPPAARRRPSHPSSGRIPPASLDRVIQNTRSRDGTMRIGRYGFGVLEGTPMSTTTVAFIHLQTQEMIMELTAGTNPFGEQHW